MPMVTVVSGFGVEGKGKNGMVLLRSSCTWSADKPELTCIKLTLPQWESSIGVAVEVGVLVVSAPS